MLAWIEVPLVTQLVHPLVTQLVHPECGQFFAASNDFLAPAVLAWIQVPHVTQRVHLPETPVTLI
jgi:hypothetical protein